MQPPLQAVLFDLDGTLVDTADDFIPVVQTLRAENGLAPLPAAQICSQVSNGARALVRLALGLEDTATEFEHWRQRLLTLYGEVVGQHAEVYPPLRGLVRELQSRGVAWGIATNKPRLYTEALLARLQMNPAPGSVVCADDVPESKPHPAMLERALAELRASAAHSIYVGDHRRDMEAGQRAHMHTIAVSYGYLGPGDEPQDWGADRVVHTADELAQTLLALSDARAA